MEKAEIHSIEAMRLKYHHRWAGHVSRMEEHRLPKVALYGEMSTVHEEIGGPISAIRTVSRRPSPHVMLTLYAGQAWLLTVMHGAIRSSKWSTSLKKTEEMH